jgi:hypothetical protein
MNNKKLPSNVTEEEFLEALDKVMPRLVKKYRFGYHEESDMRQEGIIFGLKALEKYDRDRPLANFLWTHLRNRFFNFKRNNYQRPDKPCLKCPLYDPHCLKSANQCVEFPDKNDCKPFVNWSRRNNSKKNIMVPQNIDNISDSCTTPDDPANLIGSKEMLDYLDKNITKPEYREIYLKLKNGARVSSTLIKKLRKHVEELLENKNVNE